MQLVYFRIFFCCLDGFGNGFNVISCGLILHRPQNGRFQVYGLFVYTRTMKSTLHTVQTTPRLPIPHGPCHGTKAKSKNQEIFVNVLITVQNLAGGTLSTTAVDLHVPTLFCSLLIHKSSFSRASS